MTSPRLIAAAVLTAALSLGTIAVTSGSAGATQADTSWPDVTHRVADTSWPF